MEAAMRSEEEMMHLILQVAKDDERVRAVYLNGSRTNPNAPKDRFQDYDVVYHRAPESARRLEWRGR